MLFIIPPAKSHRYTFIQFILCTCVLKRRCRLQNRRCRLQKYLETKTHKILYDSIMNIIWKAGSEVKDTNKYPFWLPEPPLIHLQLLLFFLLFLQLLLLSSVLFFPFLLFAHLHPIRRRHYWRHLFVCSDTCWGCTMHSLVTFLWNVRFFYYLES